MYEPAVSVVLPTHNRASFLKRAMDSVIAQTWESWELLVVDDGSEDETRGLVSRVDDSRVRYFRHGSNRGAAAARNTGIRAAKGRYLAFLDSDDEWHSEKLTVQINLMERSEESVGLIYSRSAVFDVETQTMQVIPSQLYEGAVYEELLSGWCPPMTSSVLAAQQLIVVAGGFDENLTSFHDYDLWLRLASTHEFRAIGQPLVIQHEHDQSRLSGDSVARRRALETFMEKWSGEIEAQVGPGAVASLRRKHLSTVFWQSALKWLREGRRVEAVRFFAKYAAVSSGDVDWRRWCGFIAGLLGGIGLYDSLVNLWRRARWTKCERRTIVECLDVVSVKSE